MSQVAFCLISRPKTKQNTEDTKRERDPRESTKKNTKRGEKERERERERKKQTRCLRFHFFFFVFVDRSKKRSFEFDIKKEGTYIIRSLLFDLFKK